MASVWSNHNLFSNAGNTTNTAATTDDNGDWNIAALLAQAQAKPQPQPLTPEGITAEIQSLADPTATADQISDQMLSPNCSPAIVAIYASGLSALPTDWPHLSTLQTTLTRTLLEQLVTVRVDEDETIRSGRLNCGALLGELFQKAFIAGDGLDVATRLLQADLKLVSQHLAVCNMAEACLQVAQPPAAAAFWKVVSERAATHVDADVRLALHLRLSRFIEAMLISHPSVEVLANRSGHGSPTVQHQDPFVAAPAVYTTVNITPSDDEEPVKPKPTAADNLRSPTMKKEVTTVIAPTKKPVEKDDNKSKIVVGSDTKRSSTDATNEARPFKNDPEKIRRTVFVSDLVEDALMSSLRECLDRFGKPLKVRIVSGSMSFMGYVEMATIADAEQMLAAQTADLGGNLIRFRTVKTAITGNDASDGAIDADGCFTRPCTFGTCADHVGRTLSEGDKGRKALLAAKEKAAAVAAKEKAAMNAAKEEKAAKAAAKEKAAAKAKNGKKGKK